MHEETKGESTLSQQMADFKRQNPKVAKAMELFGITLKKYQEALDAMRGIHVYQSASTAGVNNIWREANK